MPNDKQAALENMKKEWQALVSLLGKVPADKQETPIPAGGLRLAEGGTSSPEGGWSPKDVMGHMTTWEDAVAANLKALLAGKEYIKPYSDFNAYNDQELARKRKLSLADVKKRFEQSHRELLKLLESLPEDYFQPGSKTATLIANETFKHYAGHAKDMQQHMKG